MSRVRNWLSLAPTGLAWGTQSERVLARNVEALVGTAERDAEAEPEREEELR